MKLIVKSFLLAGIAAGLLPTPSSASTVTIDAGNSGWYDSSGYANGVANNIFTGYFAYRNWLGFDLSSVSGTITAATLEAGSDSANSQNQSITWSDVTTPYASLGISSVDTYNDLGSGTVFATGLQDPGVVNYFTINASGLASLNAASSFWAIGGRNDSGYEAFGYTSGVSSGDHLKLVLTVGTASVPEAGSTMALLGLAVGGMVAVRRKLA